METSQGAQPPRVLERREATPSQSLAWTSAHKVIAGTTLAISVTGASLFYSLAPSSKTTVWMTATGMMLAMMYVGIFRFRRASLKPWLLIAGGLSSAYLAMFLMNYGHWFGLSFGRPSLLDALSLANYPLAATGAIIMLSRHHVRTGLHALLETITLTIAGGLLIWVYVGVGATKAADMSGLAQFVAALYPMGNVLLLAVLAAVAVRLRELPSGMILVTLGIVGNLGSDLISSYQRVEGTYASGGWVDFGWLLCFAGLSVAPSVPEPGTRSLASSLDRDEGQMGAGRLAVLLFALFSAPAILIGRGVFNQDVSETIATIGTVVVFALALARIALYNQDLRRNQEQLRQAHAQLEQANDDKQSLLWRINRAVEEERSRIAAELHDRPVQRLAAVGYQVEMASIALAAGENDRAGHICDEIADELSEQLTALRSLMVEVRPPVLDERGLLGALDDAGRQFARSNDGTEVNVSGDDLRLDTEIETVLYRIAQEAFNNIAKHAEASLVTIHLDTAGESVSMIVRDNGTGFDTGLTSQFVRDGRYGMAGMGERIAMVDGSMHVDSRPGAGTSLTFKMIQPDRANASDTTNQTIALAGAATGAI